MESSEKVIQLTEQERSQFKTLAARQLVNRAMFESMTELLKDDAAEIVALKNRLVTDLKEKHGDIRAYQWDEARGVLTTKGSPKASDEDFVNRAKSRIQDRVKHAAGDSISEYV